VDGADVLDVYRVALQAVDRARAGEGPTLIEAVVAETGDPLERVRTWLASQNMLDAAAEATLRREVEAELAALA